VGLAVSPRDIGHLVYREAKDIRQLLAPANFIPARTDVGVNADVSVGAAQVQVQVYEQTYTFVQVNVQVGRYQVETTITPPPSHSPLFETKTIKWRKTQAGVLER
jgi:hypothetical protein